jgi:hypothetical protein
MGSRETVCITLTQYVRKLRGISQPILARARNGCTYVVKFNRNAHGNNVLFNECAGNILYRTLGLKVTTWALAIVTPEFLGKHNLRSANDQDGVSFTQNLCFAAPYLGDLYRVFEILPGTSFARVENRESFWLSWIVDVCARHCDNRQALFVQIPRGYKAVFIDNGDMFGGPNGTLTPHCVASRYLDGRIYSVLSERIITSIRSNLLNLNTDRVWSKINAIPKEWRVPIGLSRFAECLNNLTDSAYVSNALDKVREVQDVDMNAIYARKPIARIDAGSYLASSIVRHTDRHLLRGA